MHLATLTKAALGVGSLLLCSCAAAQSAVDKVTTRGIQQSDLSWKTTQGVNDFHIKVTANVDILTLVVNADFLNGSGQILDSEQQTKRDIAKGDTVSYDFTIDWGIVLSVATVRWTFTGSVRL